MQAKRNGLTAAVLAGAVLASVVWSSWGSGEEKMPQLNDLKDFFQRPVRNRDLARLIKESDLIAIVVFRVNDVLKAKKKEWKVRIPGYAHNLIPSLYKRPSTLKGKPGKITITIVGDPAAFVNRPCPYISGKSFAVRDEFLVFLQSTGKEGVYKPHPFLPGGMRMYRGRQDSDHRTLFAGKSERGWVVEGGYGYRGSRMSGPTHMMDVLRGLGKGVKLEAKSLGGAKVELKFTRWNVPEGFRLIAPLLWAEMEGEDGEDYVLLSREDYLPFKDTNPFAKRTKKNTLVVELPTGPVPEGASLIWAYNNHRKRLYGSLPEGKHTVYFFCRLSYKGGWYYGGELVMSNPVVVEGKAGGARPADLKKLKGYEYYAGMYPEGKEKQPMAKAGRVAGGKLDKSTFKGKIYFHSNRDGSWDIFVMNADGTGVVNLTNTKDADEVYPRPSPDGKTVAYVRFKGKHSRRRTDIWGIKPPKGKEIWLMDADGKNQRKLVDLATRPSWGPDGKVLVYSKMLKDKRGRWYTRVIVHFLDSGKTIDPLAKWRAWLRAGGEAVFATKTRKMVVGGKLWTTTGGVLFVVDFNEKYEPVKLTPLGVGYIGCNPQWSSTGRWVYFAHHDPKYNGDIILWKVNPDGTGAKRFETPKAKRFNGYGMYCESPDGSLFVYSIGPGLAAMRISDGESVTLVKFNGRGIRCDAPWWQ